MNRCTNNIYWGLVLDTLQQGPNWLCEGKRILPILELCILIYYVQIYAGFKFNFATVKIVQS